MKFTTVATTIAAVAVCNTVTALPAPGSTCVVDLVGTPYSSLALRPTPCTNGQPLGMLIHGQGLTVVSNQQQSGCGSTYTKVSYTAPNGQEVEGFVGSDFVNCNYEVPRARDARSAQQLCGTWAIQRDGPNTCGPGYELTGNSHTTCNQNGSNCQAVCCMAISR